MQSAGRGEATGAACELPARAVTSAPEGYPHTQGATQNYTRP